MVGGRAEVARPFQVCSPRPRPLVDAEHHRVSCHDHSHRHVGQLGDGLTPTVCGLVMMMAGDAVLYYPAQRASSLVVYNRGHLSSPEICRFGLWMTLVAYVVILMVALAYWAAVGEPLMLRLTSEPAREWPPVQRG